MKVMGVHFNFTPFAMAKMSNGFYQASENYQAKDLPLLNYFLYCVSIELGLKAALLSVDNSKETKKILKEKYRHDLGKIHYLFQKKFSHENLLDSNDLKTIRKINPFYKNKGLEYITSDVIVALMKGMSPFPNLSDLKKVAKKINDFLLYKKFFING